MLNTNLNIVVKIIGIIDKNNPTFVLSSLISLTFQLIENNPTFGSPHFGPNLSLNLLSR